MCISAGGQRKTCRSLFFPSTVCGPQESNLASLDGKLLYPLNHITGPQSLDPLGSVCEDRQPLYIVAEPVTGASCLKGSQKNTSCLHSAYYEFSGSNSVPAWQGQGPGSTPRAVTKQNDRIKSICLTKIRMVLQGRGESIDGDFFFPTR